MGRVGRPLSKVYDAHFNVRVKETTLTRLNALVDSLGISRSELVREYIEQGLANETRDHSDNGHAAAAAAVVEA